MSLYIKRSYRNKVFDTGLLNYEVKINESDLFVSTKVDLSKETYVILENTRNIIENHINIHPEFKDSLNPLDILENTPPLIKQMLIAARKANVGPMAAVAGSPRTAGSWRLHLTIPAGSLNQHVAHADREHKVERAARRQS